ncbi:FMN-dependent dehydrogenase domain-containing protein [Ditylenchus destructor]|nr:FMN-dependent dehydrogenase domain-containing protein [Ditylenchus destructor]
MSSQAVDPNVGSHISTEMNLSTEYVSVEDVERRAFEILPKAIAGYYSGGAADEQTVARNRTALNRLLIRPLTLRDVSQLDTRVHLSFNSHGKSFVRTVPFPLSIAPVAFQCMAHAEGEKATVRAAGDTQTLMICSSYSNFSLEEIARDAPNGTGLWFQVSMCKDRKITEDLVKRAIAAGMEALVITPDPITVGRIRNNVRHGFVLPSHLRVPNFEPYSSDNGADLRHDTVSLVADSLTWADLEWVIRISTIPVILKGVMRPEDAERAIQCGVSGIIVSNLGGRSLDYAPSTIEALSEVSVAVKGRCPLFMDGGIRTGTDIFKAIALGAEMVFIGRPIIYGLTVAGQEGVKHVLKILRGELQNAMKVSGCSTLEQIRSNRQMVVHEKYYSKF